MSVEISHREALSLISEAELVALKVKADAPGLIRIVIHVGAMALTGSAILSTDSPFLLAPLVVAHGIGLVFLFAPLHETIHDTAFRTPALNRVVGLLAGFLLVLPPLYFRYFHFAHHRHTQDPAHDPELATERPAAWLPYLWRLTGYDYWKAEIAMLLRLGFGSSVDGFIPARAQAKVVGEARGFLAAYAVVAVASVGTGSTLAVWLWLLPALAGQPFLRAFLLAEHGGLPLVPDMLKNSRTTVTNVVVRTLAWNMPHHTAHHALPTVPFHRLPALTRRLQPHIAATARGYVAAHADYRRTWPRQHPSA